MRIFFPSWKISYNRWNIHVEHITCDANVPFMYLTARMIIVFLKLQKNSIQWP